MVYNNHSQYTQAGGRSPPNGQRLVEWSTPHHSSHHSSHHTHHHTASSASSSSSCSSSSSNTGNSSSCASSTISQSDSAHLSINAAMLPTSGRCMYSRCFRISYIVYMLAACMTIQTVFFLTYHMGLGGSSLYRSRNSNGDGGELIAPSDETNNNFTQILATYPPLNNKAQKRKWNSEAQTFLRQYNVVCERLTASQHHNNTDQLCPCVPTGLLGQIPIDLYSGLERPLKALGVRYDTATTTSTGDLVNSVPAAGFNDLQMESLTVVSTPPGIPLHWSQQLQSGGTWKPSNCVSRQKVAIIIPFRDREPHLRLFLGHIHPILMRQNIHYRVFVVEQKLPVVFNKASMMNIGFKIARDLFDFDCAIFHDVDMLLEDDRNFYTCSGNPRHVGAYIDKYKYRLIYQEVFGGVTAFSAKDFVTVNGFSNSFYGWGGEDDDMLRRVRTKGLKTTRYPASVARFKMIHHESDQRNPYNFFSYMYSRYNAQQYINDGYSQIQYIPHNVTEYERYTWIYASIDTPLNEFVVYHGGCIDNSYKQLEVLLEGCAKACFNDTRCVSFVYNSHGCKLKSDSCNRTYDGSSQYLYVKKSYQGPAPRLMMGNQNTGVLEYFSAVPGFCDSDSIINSFDLLIDACAMICAEDDLCLTFMHSNDTGTTYGEGSCILLSSACDNVSPSTGITTYRKGSTSVLSYYTQHVGSNCIGGDIYGARISAIRCAHECSMIPECVAFVYVPKHRKMCWLKRKLCPHMKRLQDATFYIRHKNVVWYMSGFGSSAGTRGLTAIIMILGIIALFALCCFKMCSNDDECSTTCIEMIATCTDNLTDLEPQKSPYYSYGYKYKHNS